MEKSIRLRAFAKINLGLRILAERPDAYHEIRTIYQTIALHDRLEISLRKAGERIRFECDNPEIPSGGGNLVYRACDLWRRARGFPGGVRVRLEKMIPAGSGLGGASSDAAATLEGLERLTGEKLPPRLRFSLAAQLGSDVPLFLLGGRVFGCGRGEEVYPLPDLPPRKCLVVFPGFPISTAEAYREAGLRLTSKGKVRSISDVGAWPQFPLMNWGPAENDFERVVF
ncbi:MAG: 4-(cytidine 5'-diphospho)-2-C-methyl-D-erythritol kinase, partial [Terriglobia bacterium]